MKRDFHSWHSPSLGRGMDLLVFGHAGLPFLVFPTSQGRFFEYEDRGMVDAVRWQLDQGHMQLFCPDSVDAESWYNKAAHPADRVLRHMAYERYIMDELTPLIRNVNPAANTAGIVTTGCSFGGYHALNLALKHPGVFSRCVSMSGAFDMRPFLSGYFDDNCYFCNPVDYLPQTRDPWFFDRYRESNRFLLAAGEWDICRGENQRMADIMQRKDIPHRLDIWGERAVHDWPLWQRMAQAYFR